MSVTMYGVSRTVILQLTNLSDAKWSPVPFFVHGMDRTLYEWGSCRSIYTRLREDARRCPPSMGDTEDSRRVLTMERTLIRIGGPAAGAEAT